MGVVSTAKPPVVSEAAHQKTLTQALDAFGWRWCHFTKSLSVRGRHLTALVGAPGWVDIMAARGDRLLLIEVKSDRGSLDREQKLWASLLEQGPAEYHVARPRNWDETERILR